MADEYPKGSMPRIRSLDVEDKEPFGLPISPPAPEIEMEADGVGVKDAASKLARKMQERSDKLRQVRRNLNDPELCVWVGELDKQEYALGSGPNKMMIGAKGFAVNVSGNSNNPTPLKMTDDENVLSPGSADMSIKADMNKVDFNNKVLNKRLFTGGTSVYNHFPPVLTRPPALLQSKVKNILKVVVLVGSILEGLSGGSDR